MERGGERGGESEIESAIPRFTVGLLTALGEYQAPCPTMTTTTTVPLVVGPTVITQYYLMHTSGQRPVVNCQWSVVNTEYW